MRRNVQLERPLCGASSSGPGFHGLDPLGSITQRTVGDKQRNIIVQVGVLVNFFKVFSKQFHTSSHVVFVQILNQDTRLILIFQLGFSENEKLIMNAIK